MTPIANLSSLPNVQAVPLVVRHGPLPVHLEQKPKVTIKTAIYAGTFDPITKGHEDLIARAALLFDHLVIGVAVAHHKITQFDLQERCAMVAHSIKHVPNATVMPLHGLLVDFCQKHDAVALVRGVRHVSDFDFESKLAATNRQLHAGMETLFLLPDVNLQHISSSMVREIHTLGGDVSKMVNANVLVQLSLKKVHLVKNDANENVVSSITKPLPNALPVAWGTQGTPWPF